jgi:Conserved protein/domain typically associated with flavoprotein oxygenases, DIM6/NTAB family
MNKSKVNISPCLKPAPKALVSCRDLNGEENALAVAYCCNCSYDPPMLMVGIVPSRYSYHMIKNAGCFVVNITQKDNKELFDYLGSHSQKDCDKFSEFHVKTEPAKIVSAPILSDCPVNIECTVVDSIVTGSHEMFVGKIEYVHANSELVLENGDIDFAKIDLL